MLEAASSQEDLEAARAEESRITNLVFKWRNSSAMEEMEPGGPADRTMEMAAIIGDIGLGVQDISGCTPPMKTSVPLRMRVLVSLLCGDLQPDVADRVIEALHDQVVIDNQEAA